MFSKSKSWMGGGGVWKPKNPHSLEHLKYLHGVLCKNQTVTEQNLSLLVETLRSISEILIWGDQNDSSVFDFFLEKNMLVFFLRFMRQKAGHIICVQLLQTLNILFDNISNETSVYYLLSNNHINSIIVHKFDFSDEEVMAYYISFLKTLSLKLNKHTIHFFYNEHTNDFALYTEAIKFFNHSESMVRIAVRTITLNVYRACRFTSQLDEFDQPIVDDRCMLRYIRDKTAAPYFSNLVYFIGDHVLTLDACIRGDSDHNSRGRLADLVAEHLDQLHYLNDILCLRIEALNEVLTDHLLNRLFIPLYINSIRQLPEPEVVVEDVPQPRLNPSLALFLLSQVLLILHHPSLVRRLADIICNDPGGDGADDASEQDQAEAGCGRVRRFLKPEPLAETLDKSRGTYSDFQTEEETDSTLTPRSDATEEPPASETSDAGTEEEIVEEAAVVDAGDLCRDAEAEEALPSDAVDPHPNSTDEEKLLKHSATSILEGHPEVNLRDRPYFASIMADLDCTVDDYQALFALCLLYALGHNDGINQELLDTVLLPTDKSQTKHHYNTLLVQQLIQIMSLACQNGSKVRLATLELTVRLMRNLVYKDGHCFLQDGHLAAVEGVREEATLQLRNFYKVWEKSEEIFLDMFEDEYRELSSRPLNVEYLTMDASILLPPTGTPLTGIDFSKRLPCGEVERARRAIRVFFLIRDLSYTLRQEPEHDLPLTKDEECVKVNDVLDLNNSDLIACTIVTGEKKERRFLVIDIIQLILVEPDSRRLGWGVVRFVGFLQDVEVTGDRDDSRCLHVTIHKPTMNFTHGRPLPILSARFIFDDHIRCMAAKQRLTKGRLKARQRKMQMIARLLDLPAHLVDSLYPQTSSVPQSAASLRTSHPGQAVNVPGRSHAVVTSSDSTSKQNASNNAIERSVFASVDQVPAFHTAREHEQGSRRPTSKLPGTVSSQVPLRTFRVKTGEGETPSPAELKRSTKLLLTMAKEAKRTRQLRANDETNLEGGAATSLAAARKLRHSGEKSGSPRRRRDPNSRSGEGNSGATIDRSGSLPETGAAAAADHLGLERKVESLDVCDEGVEEVKAPEERKSQPDHRETAAAAAVDAEDGRGFVTSRKQSVTGTPKSLTPAEGVTLSLVVSCDEVPLRPEHGFMDSPVKLVPPAEPDDIHRLTSAAPSSATGDFPAEQSSSAAQLRERTDE